MDQLKASGLDHFQKGFFQQYQDIIGENIIKLTRQFFYEQWSLEDLNKTLLVMISKKANPERVDHFRLINLCNVIYKIIAKTLAYRLKLVISEIISTYQNAFIKGRQITNNILINHEIFHHRKKSYKKVPYMTIKIDMFEAYDRVEWDFLLTIINKMRFSNQSIS